MSWEPGYVTARFVFILPWHVIPPSACQRTFTCTTIQCTNDSVPTEDPRYLRMGQPALGIASGDLYPRPGALVLARPNQIKTALGVSQRCFPLGLVI
ncbi:hypothetical protein BDW67DRAFT_151447, partial [Aspergillus spinulosporus]